MSEAVDVQDLLTVARTTLLDRVLPALPESHRYDALMVGNAIGIVLRAMEAGDGPSRREHEGAAFLVDGTPLDAAEFSPERLAQLNAALVAAIRRGDFDGEAPAERLHRHLLDAVRDRLRVDNPKVLAR